MRRLARPSVAPALAVAIGALLAARSSGAQTPTATASPSSLPLAALPSAATSDATPPADSDIALTTPTFFPEAPLEAPPPLPRKKGLVMETSLGGMAFLGKFGDLAPPAPWLHGQLGYEFLKWLMLFGYGEIAFTGTSNDEMEASSIYFPIYGFGGGLRFTIHATDRVAFFLQPNAGAIAAIVPREALTFLGYNAAQSLGFCVGGRIGVEWYQVDRHMALGLGVGLRDALNFKIQNGESDLPLMLDASASLRYTF